MKSGFSLAILMWLVFLPIFSGAQFSLDSFLSSARNDNALAPAQAKLNFLKDNNFNSPWINRLEVRIGSENADFTLDDYRLRVTPGNPSELKANKRYHHKQVSLLNTVYQDKLNDALLERYSLVLEHYFEYKKKENIERLLSTSREIIDMMSQGKGVYAMDMGDLIDAESDELDLKMDLVDAKLSIDELEYMMKDMQSFEGSISWRNAALLETQDILNLFALFKEQPGGKHIELVKIDQQNALEAERFNIEKSESLRNIGYFQAGFDVNRGDGFSDHFGYQIGVRIPIVNPDKAQLNRRKLNLMDNEAILYAQTETNRRDIELAVLRMDHFAGQYHEISNKLKNMDRQNPLNLQIPGKGIKMSDLIKWNEFLIELMDKKIQTERSIFKTYISYLNLTGKLIEAPLRNYLSKDLNEF
ncbi:MAG: hypothetical protein HC819_14685 [Cyclobacteriaceae bacterium]|nr:hypothetical protein [Cyclobacteriaceae bacterium]